MIERHGKNLAFLLSLPRSGSTLLSALLGGHESIHAPNEPWILLALSSLYDPDQAKKRRSNSRYDNPWAISAMRDFLTRDQFSNASRVFAVSAYNSTLSEANKRIFLDKTPRYFHILPWLDELFPASKKIWLMRNPLDVAASYFTTWGIRPGALAGDPMIPASYDLSIGLQRLADYADASTGVFEVRYEEIAIEPARTLEKLCACLEVPYAETMLDYSKAALQQGGLGDKKLYQYATPHANSLGKWTSVLKREETQGLVEVIGHDLFERMGYPETIQQLKTMGIRFPSDSELAGRREEIMRRELASPIEALDDAISLARKYYRVVRESASRPWFLTRDGWLTRRIKNHLIASKQGLDHLRKRLGSD